jgi:glycosyltransferase involved in cell wall biosynthesis
MKVAHWTMCNGSGMHRVAEDLSIAETALGLTSVLVQCDDVKQWEVGKDADVHVVHTHLPDCGRRKDSKIVYVGHGTPEHVFKESVTAGLMKGYGAGDFLMLAYHWIKVADAVVVWWPRAQALWQQICMKPKTIDCVPLGIDLDFWKPLATRGKWAGIPSLLSAENCHDIKWPLDLIWMWPWIFKNIPDARMHILYVPRDQHRWWFPLLYATDAIFKTFVSGDAFAKDDLRNAFNSVDYYINLVRYGDFNKVGLEAKASGCKVISYTGNPYSDYWLPEGDQRVMATELEKILKGEVAPRKCEDVPSRDETAKRMKAIYERILC